MENKEIIRICTEHQKQIPLIFTQAFENKKYWCPHCGATYNDLTEKKITELTDTLKKRRAENLKKSSDFLNAKLILSTDKKVDVGGHRIPKENLPDSKLDKLKEIVNSYSYEHQKKSKNNK